MLGGRIALRLCSFPSNILIIVSEFFEGFIGAMAEAMAVDVDVRGS